MLLFDDGKRLEKAVGEEAAQIIVSILERLSEEQKHETATRGDLREAELRLETKVEASKSELKSDIASSKHEILKWVIGMLLAQTGVLAALYALMK